MKTSTLEERHVRIELEDDEQFTLPPNTATMGMRGGDPHQPGRDRFGTFTVRLVRIRYARSAEGTGRWETVEIEVVGWLAFKNGPTDKGVRKHYRAGGSMPEKVRELVAQNTPDETA
jgi:hypothetical protein